MIVSTVPGPTNTGQAFAKTYPAIVKPVEIMQFSPLVRAVSQTSGETQKCMPESQTQGMPGSRSSIIVEALRAAGPALEALDRDIDSAFSRAEQGALEDWRA
jgi:hypothetical protein